MSAADEHGGDRLKLYFHAHKKAFSLLKMFKHHWTGAKEPRVQTSKFHAAKSLCEGIVIHALSWLALEYDTSLDYLPTTSRNKNQQWHIPGVLIVQH